MNTLSIGDLHFEDLRFDDLRFEVRLSAGRRAMEITLGRDGELILSAPPEVTEATLLDFVQRKRMWIYQQLARQQTFAHEVPAKVFTDGEGFLYLGRSYRLRLVDESIVPVKLLSGRLVMPRHLAGAGREHLVNWYCGRAKRWLSDKAGDFFARMEVAPAGVKVQDLGYRWGSCGKGGWLYFHWKTILLPARIAEYVVVHEMAHLHEPHHTPEFWRRVERALPDFELRKDWLSRNGGAVEGL